MKSINIKGKGRYNYSKYNYFYCDKIYIGKTKENYFRNILISCNLKQIKKDSFLAILRAEI